MSVVVLRGRQALAPERPLSADYHYDVDRQIWVDEREGTALVEVLANSVAPTNFGETLITATREGVDQSEISALGASQFGETTMTKTHEGADQFEIASLDATTFGETTLTRTHEGADQTETS